MTNEIFTAERLPPREATRFFRQKLDIPTKQWGEISSEGYAKSFAVAGAMEDALLNGFRRAVQKAIEQGTGLKEFRKDFDKLVAKHGWDYHGSRKWRSRLIYQTNLSAAYSAGRYRQMTTPNAVKLYPYWRYKHHNCVNPRKEHIAWDGIILPWDHPWWNTHYPPCGWGCHCSVEQISEGKILRDNLKVSEPPPTDPSPWKNPATGEIIQIPKGIDPGFQANIGKEWLKSEERRSVKSLKPVHYSKNMPQEERSNAQKIEIEKILKPEASGIVTAGTLPEKVKDILGSESDDVLLSKETLQKQSIAHSDLNAADYEMIPEVISDPDYVFKSHNDKAVILLFLKENFGYKMAVKRTSDKLENYLTSFVKLTGKTLSALLKNGDVLWDKKDGSS